MASIIEGYNYDIFISYRQKDNKHDGWVTEFVDNLKGELESTFKEEISVYFDINPHDGLLETHDVDESLKEKLKCLIFIPIISRTYCDPKSFAWEHELKAFVEQASQDQFGLKVKLPNGNVASRVLPIRIHDLDNADIKLCESVLGGVLRGIEFIYKESGVDRPLMTKDNEEKNLNKTNYRNQINKVALAIREIIPSVGHIRPQQGVESKEVFMPISVRQKNRKTKIIAGSFIVLALIIFGFFLFPKLIEPSAPAEKSIAVLPFKLLSDEPNKQYLADGMMEAILLHLSKIRDIRVLGSTSVEQYRQTNKTIQTIGKELNVEYVLEGNFQKYGDNARLIVQLIRTRNESHIWSNEYNRTWNDILTVQSEVAQAIAGELHAVITPEEKMIIETRPTLDLTAYDYYLQGKDYQKRSYSEKDIRYAIQMFEKAIEIDTRFALAWTGLAACSRDLFWFGYDRSQENFSSIRQYLEKALTLSPGLKEVRIEEALYFYQCKLDYIKSLEILEKLKSEYPNDDEIYSWIGSIYRRMGEYGKSLDNINHALSLNPSSWDYLLGIAHSLCGLREYENAENYYKRAIELNPSYSDIYDVLFEFYIATGQIQKAKGFLTDNERSFDSQYAKLYKAQLEFLARNYKEAINIMHLLSEEAINSQDYYYTKHLLLGLMYRTVSDNEMAIKHFEIERKFLLAKLTDSEYDQRLYRSLGIACAGLGMEEQALKAGRKALEILDFSKDALSGYLPEMDMVRILVMVGESDEALMKLDQIIKRTGYSTVENLKIDPFWDRIRNNEKFKEIISNPEYQISLSQ